MEPTRGLERRQQVVEEALRNRHPTKTNGNMSRPSSWYKPDFTNYRKTLVQWQPTLQANIKKLGGRSVQIKDVFILCWKDSNETLAVMLGEVVLSAKQVPPNAGNETKNWPTENIF